MPNAVSTIELREPDDRAPHTKTPNRQCNPNPSYHRHSRQETLVSENESRSRTGPRPDISRRIWNCFASAAEHARLHAIRAATVTNHDGGNSVTDTELPAGRGFSIAAIPNFSSFGPLSCLTTALRPARPNSGPGGDDLIEVWNNTPVSVSDHQPPAVPAYLCS